MKELFNSLIASNSLILKGDFKQEMSFIPR